jgi:hypothetical protein
MIMTTTPINWADWKASAAIDYITISFPKKLRTLRDARSLEGRGQGTIEVPRKLGSRRPHGCDWLTVHDPDRHALQYLIEEFPESEVLALEICVDLRPASGKAVPAQFAAAHAWLKMALNPNRHPTMRGKVNKKIYDPFSRKIRKVGLKPSSGSQTVYWETRTAFEQVRLYVKKEDAHINPFPPSTRIEVTWNRGGCQVAGIKRLKTLPAFAPNLRTYISPFLDLATGIKPKVRRVRSKNPAKMIVAEREAKKEGVRVMRNWQKYGASWAAKHGYKTIPDRHGNKLIGTALNELRRNLMKLKLT